MQTETFIERAAAAYSGIPPEDSARAATLATLQALCEHLQAEEIRRLASQLPRELAEAAEAGGESIDHSGREIELPQFYARVGTLAGLHTEEAGAWARAVVRTLHEAVTAGEIGDMELELPGQLAELLREE